MNAAPRLARAILLVLIATLPTAASHAAGFKFLEVTVNDPDGQPVANAEVTVTLAGATFPMPTDDQGKISLNVPDGGETATTFVIKHEGHVTVGVMWKPGDPVPENLTVTLEKAVAIGGIVHDEKGNPLVGVTIEGQMLVNGNSEHPGQGKVIPYVEGEIAVTNADGRWKSTSMPDRPMQLRLKFSNPGYLSDDDYGTRGGTWEELRSLEKIVVLEKGLEVHGTVTDPNGQPVANASVGLGRGRFYSDYQTVNTDDQGKYSLKNVKPDASHLTITSPDWAPDMRAVTPRKDAPPEDFQLGPPHTVRLRIVDPTGQPIAGVEVFVEQWRGIQTLTQPTSGGETNADGVWEWRAAPPDEVCYTISKQGRFGIRDSQAKYLPSDEIQQITMLPAPVVLGTVLDKQTREPIKQFRYVEGVWWEPNYDSPALQVHRAHESADGKFRFEMQSGCEKFLIRVEADGYRPVESRAILPTESQVELTFEMEPGTGPAGIVKLPDGSPAAGVKVAMATANQQVAIYNGEMQTDFAAGHGVTDDQGRFQMPFAEGDFAIVCVGDAGWAVVQANQDAEQIEATLEPWGRVEGISLRGAEPIRDEQISCYRNQSYEQNAPRVFWQSYVQTDSEGRFVFERLHSGEATFARNVRYADRGNTWMSANTHTVTVDVKPNETNSIHMGGTGRQVFGQLTAPADMAERVDWKMGAVSLQTRRNPTGSRGFFYDLGRVLGQASSLGVEDAPPATDERPSATYSSAIDAAGRFEIVDVPPGDYDLQVTLYEKLDGNDNNFQNLGMLRTFVTIPAEGEGPFDLGKHELQFHAR